MPEIRFFKENVKFLLRKPSELKTWLEKCAKTEGKVLLELNYIFCDDTYLRKINQEYLHHDYYTDVITFPHMEPGERKIGGDIYISIDRVKENAVTYHSTFGEELHRVMVHGLLHLCGYDDETPREQVKIRQMEDLYLEKQP